jgi:phosphoribosylaminoimidazolecarboxamide formyltransferase/IMP cyclohydrolase
VVVNLYPFEATVAKPNVSLHDAIENIDIGGPSMLRSAAKNHDSVTVIVDPADYADSGGSRLKPAGNTTLELRRTLAAKVYARTAAYDAAIAAHLEKAFNPATVSACRSRWLSPRRWRNRCVTARTRTKPPRFTASSASTSSNCTGRNFPTTTFSTSPPPPRSSTNSTAMRPRWRFSSTRIPAASARARTLREAWDKAFATDRQAPFGGIIAVNRPLDAACAEAIAEIFSEVIVAPDFTAEALAILQKKKNLRLLKTLKNLNASQPWDVRSVGADSFLMQQRDLKITSVADLKIVTKRQPTEAELQAMLFGWRVVKHLKSNAILYSNHDRTLGVGAGQMSRVDSSRIAVWKAGEAKLSLQGSVVCSDAFFPFPDGLIAAAEAGATAAIQPGGSVKDAEVIAAADERGLAMAFTGTRHFRH